MLTKKGVERTPRTHLPLLSIENVDERNNNFEPKIKLPYNWLVSSEMKLRMMKLRGKKPISLI